MSEALELQIEAAWVALTNMPPKRRRTVYLTQTGRVIWGPKAERPTRRVEVGTYSNTVRLVDFRDDVFYAHENMRDAA